MPMHACYSLPVEIWQPRWTICMHMIYDDHALFFRSRSIQFYSSDDDDDDYICALELDRSINQLVSQLVSYQLKYSIPSVVVSAYICLQVPLCSLRPDDNIIIYARSAGSSSSNRPVHSTYLLVHLLLLVCNDQLITRTTMQCNACNHRRRITSWYILFVERKSYFATVARPRPMERKRKEPVLAPALERKEDARVQARRSPSLETTSSPVPLFL